LRHPHALQRWTIAHSPPRLTQIAIGSITARHADARSPGDSSTCRLHRHDGQWFRCSDPYSLGLTARPHFLQLNPSLRPRWRCLSDMVASYIVVI
jgi:hypothetical protein